MTQDELDAIRERLAAAKAWRPFDGSWDDIAFGQRAAQDVEALLAEVDRLQLEACHHLAALGTAEILKAGWQRDTERLTRERDDAYRRGVQDAVVSVETAYERWSQKAATRIRAELLEEWNGEDVTLREHVKSAFRRGVRVMREAAAQACHPMLRSMVDRGDIAATIRAMPDPEDKS